MPERYGLTKRERALLAYVRDECGGVLHGHHVDALALRHDWGRASVSNAMHGLYIAGKLDKLRPEAQPLLPLALREEER